MRTRYKLLGLVVLLAFISAVVVGFFRHHNIAVLNTKGQVGDRERNLIIFATLLSLLVVIPVFIMTIVIALRYRETNTKAKYSPDWDHSLKLETTWWLVPTLLILILSTVAWKSSHQLDPFRPIQSNVKPVTVQVVALEWKWLFIYPEQGVASLNYLVIPANTPINFQVTADAPMNSFWIPQLGGQIYAMSGMSTQLHLIANSTGSYTGRSANISGSGFAGMQFLVRSVSASDFEQWRQLVGQSYNLLNTSSYQELAQPSRDNPVTYYSQVQPELYNSIVMKFMDPAYQVPSLTEPPHHEHSGVES